jgi:ABC-type polysaccharide/polyol phosphate transport system ATPase subunit
MSRNPIAIKVDDVTQRFRLIQERPDTVRELFSKLFSRKVHYHEFDAVRNVSLEVRKGEMVGIIGRNGSGKSTLLKMVAGVYIPSSGCIQVHGTIAPLIELGAGFHSELTGRENVILNGLLLGYSRRQMLAREQSILEFADIGDFIDSPVKQYSSGMYMRLAFAVATEVNPDILVVDEILAVGDTAFQKKCFQRLERFRAAGKTILFVTHSMGQIKDFCDRALLLDHGRVVLEGSPEEVVDLYLTASPTAQTPELVEATST